MTVAHKPLREIAVKPSLQCVSFLSSSSSEWAIAEDSISLVVSDKNIVIKQKVSELNGGGLVYSEHV